VVLLVRPPGFGPGLTAWKASFEVNWLEVKEDFVNYLRSISYNERTIKDILRYLDRYVDIIRRPLDIINLFSEVKHGKRHLILGLRKLFSFYEVLGYEKANLDSLRKALPRIQCGIDIKIPSESEIITSIRKLKNSPMKYQALYDLLLDSGLRLIEAVELINSFENSERIKGFYRCKLAMFRGEKQAYFAHFTELTLKNIRAVKDKLDYMAASNYFRKKGCIAPKYLRKYAFDKMIELEIPESVADFIEGRVPKSIGARHYLALARQSSRFYPRYATYIDKLRSGEVQS